MELLAKYQNGILIGDYMKLLAKYQNGNLTTKLYEDGTRIRETDDDEFYPAFAENVDVQVSNRCDHGCPMCYANCTPDGAFGKLRGWKFLDTLHPGTEMAINLNFPMDPNLIDFLRTVKSKGVFPNVTINQDHFIKYEHIIQQLYDEELIYGLGVSLTNPNYEFVTKIKKYPNAVIHVINGIFTQEDFNLLFGAGLKILILGYKYIGRGIQYKQADNLLIERNQRWLRNNLKMVINLFNVVSFDNLALEQLNVRRLLTDNQWKEFYSGDDGTFTFFINLVDGYFAKNSLSEKHYPIGDYSMDEMFEIIKQETMK